MRAIYALVAATLMALAFTGVLNPVVVLIMAGLSGLVRPSDMGMRAALIGDTMPPAHAVGAMGISRTTSDFARIAGALTGAGLVAALGMGPAYVAITAFYAIGVMLTWLARRAAPRARPATRGGGCHRRRPGAICAKASSYVWNTPHLLALVWLAFLVNLAAFPLTNGLLPYVAKEIYAPTRPDSATSSPASPSARCSARWS